MVWPTFADLRTPGTRARRGHRGGRSVACTEPAARWVNVVLGNLKRAISGTDHAIKQAKYARCYLGEAAYRFNRRFRLHEDDGRTKYQ